MADTATELYNTNKKFNTSVKSHKWERMQDSYASLNQTLVCWERSLKKQNEFLQTHLTKNFKYTLKEFESFTDVDSLSTDSETEEQCGTGVLPLLGGLRGQEGQAFLGRRLHKMGNRFQ